MLIYPGLLAAVTVAMAAGFLSQNYGAPVMLFALLLGMAFNFSSEPGGRCVEGISYTSKKVLRFGVALLGLRISFEELQAIGIAPIVIVVGSVITTIIAGVLISKAFGFSRNFGILTGGATAICGASAALAISAALPKSKDSERNTIFTVVCVTAFSTVAMVMYPIIVRLLGFDNYEAGVVLGATIHDVAQVVGAGYIVSDDTGDVATLIKLLRVAMLVPVVFLLAVMMAKGSDRKGGKATLPFFLVGFIALMLLNNVVDLPEVFTSYMVDFSRWCLITAIAALGMRTSLKSLTDVGGKAISLLALETVFLLVMILLIVKYVL